MKLVSFSNAKAPGRGTSIGAVTDAGIVNLGLAVEAFLEHSGVVSRAAAIAAAVVPSDMLAFIASGELGLDYASRAIDFALSRQDAGERSLLLSPDDTRLLAPVPRPNSIRDTISFEGHMRHFKERTGRAVPHIWYERPIYYKGNPSSVVGPEADILWPGFTEMLDYELEFGVIIGRRGKNIAAHDARHYIAGYLIFNDMSAREMISAEVAANLGPAKGKDFDTGNVMGPWLVTPDEINVADLRMEARINGETWSRGRSSDMMWSFEHIISFISQDETLHPGDFIGSGTVEKGCGAELDRWLKPGDVIELEVEGLGILRNRVVREVAL